MDKLDIPLIDIRPDHWEIVRGILHKHVPRYEVWAFGSRAKWTAKPYSDLDLAIITDARLASSVMTALADDFSESDLPWKVDVADWAATNEIFQTIIERDKVVVKKAVLALTTGFEPTNLGQLLSFTNGRTSPHRADGLPYPVYGSNGIIGYSNETNSPANSIIIGRVGSYCGSIYFSETACWTTDNAIRASARGDNCARYLFYLLSTLNLNNWRAGSGQPLLNQDILSHIPALVPKPTQQRAIADILCALDRKIDVNRQLNETLEKMARAIFKDWFVDFGPTRAKMAGTKPYLAPAIWKLFPDRLDDAGRPVGWTDGTLSQVADVIMGASPDGSTYNDIGIGTPLVNGPVEYGDFFLRRIKWTTSPNKLSENGDFIICVRGSTTGRHAFADGVYCLGRGVAAIRSVDGGEEFIACLMLSYLDKLLQKVTGSVFPNLSGADIRELSIIVPDADSRHEFNETVRPLRERVWSNIQENQKLFEMRDLLLPKIMSGEIRVSEKFGILKAVA